ncbi:MAG: hypothetical protein JNK32_08465 [Anaerolineales bacterium]|nr:hypothetical protein [Anaerolineales bacterium]
MKRHLLILTLSVAVLFIAACGSAPEKLVPSPVPLEVIPPSYPNQSQSYPNPAGGSIPLTEADIPRITVQDAKAAIDSGQAILVDVRSADAYAAGHAAGAISISLDKFETNIGDISLDKEKWIITYCT